MTRLWRRLLCWIGHDFRMGIIDHRGLYYRCQHHKCGTEWRGPR